MLRFAAAASLLWHPGLRAVEVGAGWLLISASFYVLNGLSDLPGDRANGSTRPLASGLLSARAALTALLISGAAGLAVCFGVSVSCGELASAFAALGIAYSVGPRLKENAVGASLTIGAGAGLTYVAGWAVRGQLSVRHILYAIVLSGWISIACATKDFSDVDGDRLAGRRTVATVLGVGSAARLISGLSALAATALLAMAWIERCEMVPAAMVLVGSSALPSAGALSAVSMDRGAKRGAYRIYMATQYAVNGSMIVLGSAA